MLKQMAVAALLGAAVIGTGSPASAQETGGLTNTLFGILGFAERAPPPIEYRERPGLVVPPRSTLPPPVDGERRRAAVNWPSDPDEAARRQGAGGESSAWADRRRMNSNAARLDNNELAAGRTARRGTWTNPDERSGALLYVPQEEMRRADAAYFRQQREVEERPVGQEPPRRYLVEPPPGYRQPTQRVQATRGPVDTRSDRDAGVREFLTNEARR